ncbi:MAG TPA: hypothetical protein VNM90_04885 [Haliangium sp.]|nr:hypothetical protein [Haliangium sp.]
MTHASEDDPTEGEAAAGAVDPGASAASATAPGVAGAATAGAKTAATAGAEPAGPGAHAHAVLAAVIDEIIERFGGVAHTSVITAARQEYDARRGRVFEDEALWEAWTQAFLEWYVLERPMSEAQGRPAAVQVLEDARRQGDTRRVAAARAWLVSHRSLFEVRALAAGRVELHDLIGGAQFSVCEPRAFAGVSVGDVAEMRLIGFEDEVLFGRTFCYHPSGTRDAIAAQVRDMRAQGGSRQDIVDFCASLRIRCQRYRHVPPARIYAAGRPQQGDGLGASP